MVWLTQLLVVEIIGVTFGRCQTKLIPSNVTFDGHQTKMILNNMAFNSCQTKKRSQWCDTYRVMNKNGPQFVS